MGVVPFRRDAGLGPLGLGVGLGLRPFVLFYAVLLGLKWVALVLFIMGLASDRRKLALVVAGLLYLAFFGSRYLIVYEAPAGSNAIGIGGGASRD